MRNLLKLVAFVAIPAGIIAFQNCGQGFHSVPNLQEASTASIDNSKRGVDVTTPTPTPSPQTKGYFSTQGNQIVNANGVPVRLSGVNWQGFEQNVFAPAGLYAENYKKLLLAIKQNGFNVVRIPFSNEMLSAPLKTKSSGFQKFNSELNTQTPMQIMDSVISYAGSIGLRVILDFHRFKADTSYEGTEVGGLWYSTDFSENDWIATWVVLAKKYKGNATVIGADLWNEPHTYQTSTVTWGGGGAKDWARAAETAASAILTANPDWLIIVGGISGYSGIAGAADNTVEWWGQNLQGVKARPIVPKVNGQSVMNKVVYSPHIYPRGIVGTNSPLMTSASYPANMPAVWTKMWGYIYQDSLAPIWIGEVAANLDGKSTSAQCTFTDATETVWIQNFFKYINGDFDLNSVSDLKVGKLAMSWAWWTFGYDTCGRYLFDDVNFSVLNTGKLNLLKNSLGASLDQ